MIDLNDLPVIVRRRAGTTPASWHLKREQRWILRRPLRQTNLWVMARGTDGAGDIRVLNMRLK